MAALMQAKGIERCDEISKDAARLSNVQNSYCHTNNNKIHLDENVVIKPNCLRLSTYSFMEIPHVEFTKLLPTPKAFTTVSA